MSTQGALASARARQRAEVLDLLAGVTAASLLVVALVGLTGPARLLLAVAFTFFVPGRAIVSNWSRMAGWSDIGMSITLSLGILTLFAAISLWVRKWHPLGLFEIEAAASLIGLGAAVLRRKAVQASAPADRVPARTGRRQPADQAHSRQAPRLSPAGQARPRPGPRSALGGPVPPRAAPRYPPAGKVPPRSAPRYPSPG